MVEHSPKILASEEKASCIAHCYAGNFTLYVRRTDNCEAFDVRKKKNRVRFFAK